jgi:hypothetical protein
MSYLAVGDNPLSWLGSAVKGAVNFYGETQQNKALAELEKAKAEAGTQTVVGGGAPDWLLPVAVVGGLGVLAFVLTRK